MPSFPYHIAAEKTDPYPALDKLPTVEAETAWKAVAKLARDGKLPAAGGQFWLRIVLEVHPNGIPAKAMSVPLTPEFEIPLDWDGPDDEPMD
jgi:hypothetical protein